MNRRLICLSFALVGTMLALGGCKEGGLGGTMSPQQERDLGAQFAADLDKHVKYVDDSKLNTRVLEIALPIFGPYQVHFDVVGGCVDLKLVGIAVEIRIAW